MFSLDNTVQQAVRYIEKMDTKEIPVGDPQLPSEEELERPPEEQALIDNGADPEAVEACVELGIALKDFDEAYQGEYPSDKEFAMDMARRLGSIKDFEWPLYCIDWEWAARDLMTDFQEHNGHYFRDL